MLLCARFLSRGETSISMLHIAFLRVMMKSMMALRPLCGFYLSVSDRRVALQHDVSVRAVAIQRDELK